MRSRNLFLACCFVALPMVGPAMAQTRPPTPTASTAILASGGESGESERPALLTFDPGVAIWTILVFLALLIILRATAWNPLLKALQDRETFIQDSIDSAKAQRDDAQRLLARYQAQLDRARVEATAIVDEGRRDAEVVRRRIQDETRQEADALLARARREIRLATDAALKELHDQTAELAVQVAERVISKELSPQEHNRLVNESLACMNTVEKKDLN
jgi:F-type H+-transporting ATPase subunit b